MNIIETNWKWNGELTSRSATDYIALHHAEAAKCTAEQVDSWHKANGWAGIGYHFFVRKNGEIYRGRPIWSLGAHVQGKNNVSVGVCAEGDYASADKTMPTAQKKALKELVTYLKGMYPSAKIVGHGEIGNSDCPGRYYPLDEMKSYPYSEEETDKTDLTARIDELYKRVSKLENPMIYNYIDDNMPEWAREGVSWCTEHGIIKGTGSGLGLDDKDLKYCTVIMRIMKNKQMP